VQTTGPQGTKRLPKQLATEYLFESIEVCRLRDGKGLYAGGPGLTSVLPGVGTVYEEPVHPDIRADGGRDSVAASAIVNSVVGG
jgi:adenylylsulfate kinase-like enzyme